MYIADQFNNRVRKVTVSTGIITTYVGTGTGSYNGDNGAATSAALYGPKGVALDASGTILLLFLLSVARFHSILCTSSFYFLDHWHKLIFPHPI